MKYGRDAQRNLSERAMPSMTRRNLLRGGAALGLGIPIVASIPAPTAGATQAATSKADGDVSPQRGGQIITADKGGYDSLDLHISNVTNPVVDQMVDYLMEYSPNFETGAWALEPGLGESWSFANDNQSLDIKLREGVVFHDGSTVDAEAIKWNLDRLREDEKSRFKQDLLYISGVEVIDTYSIRLQFAEPTASPALIALGLYTPIWSKKAFDSMGEAEFGKHPVGSGPMKYVEWVPDDHVTVEKNPNYWRMGTDGKPLPYADSALGREGIDLSQSAVELRSGAIHLYNAPAPKDIPQIKSDAGTELLELPGYYRADLSRVMLNMNVDPFTDKRIRQAALHALDHQAYANALGTGVMEPHFTLWWAPNVVGYDESIVGPEYDQERARQLLSEADMESGVDIDLKVIGRPTDLLAAQILKQMWDAVGIRTTIRSLERVAWIEQLRGADYQASVIGTSINPDPALSAQAFITGGSENWASYSNADVDTLMAEGLQTDEESKRAEIYQKVQRIMQDDAAVQIVARMPSGYAKAKSLHGVASRGRGPVFGAAWLEQNQ